MKDWMYKKIGSHKRQNSPLSGKAFPKSVYLTRPFLACLNSL